MTSQTADVVPDIEIPDFQGAMPPESLKWLSVDLYIMGCDTPESSKPNTPQKQEVPEPTLPPPEKSNKPFTQPTKRALWHEEPADEKDYADEKDNTGQNKLI